MSKMLVKVKEEIRALIPATAFFYISLHLVVLIRALMLTGTGIDSSTSVSLVLGSILLAKAVLIADIMPFINRYPEKPLIYNVVWKTVIYFLASLLIHYSEIFVDLWRKTGSFSLSYQKIDSFIVWPHFWGIQILITVLVFMYCTMRELVRVVGAKKVQRIFFGPVQKIDVSL